MELFHYKSAFFFLLPALPLFLDLFSASHNVFGQGLQAECSMLLQLKQGFTYGELDTWQSGTDCCFWEGVTCDKLKRVTGLDLSSRDIGGKIDPSLFNLTSLRSLNFAYNQFNGTAIPDYGWNNLANLASLNLSYGMFSGKVPKQILQLRKLKSFVISNNPMLSGSLPDFSEDSNLEMLDIYCTNFSGNIPDTIGNLKFLMYLDLSSCQITGRIPPSMENLSQLEVLILSNNNFNDVVELEFIKNFKNLLILDLSNSGFSLSLWDEDDGSLPSFFPNMLYLGLSSCNLTKIPSFIKYQHDMIYLDLSNNKIHGEIPSLLWNILGLNLSCNFFTHFAETPFNLSIINLSLIIDLHSNLLEGHILLPSHDFLFLDYSNNRFTSFIPSIISANPNATYLSLANNNLTGEIPPSICNLTELQILDLSNNRLVGSIPPCLIGEEMDLRMLNLGGNQLHGAIPHRVSQKCMLQAIYLGDNQLEGSLPKSLSNCRSLELLDLGNNNLNDAFPYWLGIMPSLRVLILRSNKFHGLVGPINGNHEINHTFHMLHVFDISSNNFGGNLCANYFSNFLSMMVNREDTTYLRYYVYKKEFDLDKLTIMNKGQLMTLSKIWMMVKSIDFSNNHFEGKIPMSIGQLVSLQVLNLSHNNFTSTIPPQLGNLSRLESLDLSMNNLFGKIPQDFVSLSFLSYLNLSYNKLVGQIPSRGQFSTFSNMSFEGNEGLCWFPCNTSVPTMNNTVAPGLGSDGTGTKRSYMIVLGILFGVGFGVSMMIVILIDVIYCDKGRSRRSIHG